MNVVKQEQYRFLLPEQHLEIAVIATTTSN